jgi:hypothetical protein
LCGLHAGTFKSTTGEEKEEEIAAVFKTGEW